MDNLNKVSVILPSLDPDEKLITVINGLLEYGFSDIILVNDGSKPENMHYFEEAAQHEQVHLLHHAYNRGKGAALKTAFTWFLENRPDYAGVVTVDGDNQHHPEDTCRCAEQMLKSGKLVLGVRDFDEPQVPFRSRNGNKITSAVFKIFVNMTISDTQTGLRAIPMSALPLLNTVYGDRFEYETNMLLALKENAIAFEEVKIRTVYIEENKSSHFRAFRDSWRIYKLILAHFFKYTLASICSAVIDESVFVGLSVALMSTMDGLWLTATATVTARLISSLFNFFVNKKVVFRSRNSTFKSLLKYYALAIPIAAAQSLLTYGAFVLFGIAENQTLLRAVIYGIVMLVLFVASFLVQQRWVFDPEKKNN